MQCLKASELMSQRLDGELSPGQRRALDGHLDACEECRTEWKLMRDSCAIFSGVALDGPAPSFTGEVMTKVRRRATFYRILRGVVFSLLGATMLLAMGVVPARVITELVTRVTGDPTLVGSIARVFANMADLFRTIFGAVGLLGKAIVTDPNLLLAVGGYMAVFIGVAAVWVRLAISRKGATVKQDV